MVTRLFRMSAVALGLFGAAAAVHAAGIWSTLPGLGQQSFCTSYITLGTGQGCGQTVPAGPPAFVGTEYVPADTNQQGSTDQTGGPKTVAVSLLQLGQGPLYDLTAVGTAQTIPNATPFYVVDGAQSAAFTITMPAAAVEGQVQTVVCEVATTGALTIAANSGQSIKFSPGVPCIAGTAYRYRYTASSSAWFKA